MNRVSGITLGALLFGATLLPLAPAQAEVAPQPAATQPAAQVIADGGSGSSAQSLVCTILKLIMLNQGPSSCA